MSVTVVEAMGRVELRWAWEAPGGGAPAAYVDPIAAAAFLRRLLASAGGGAALRRLAEGGLPGGAHGLDDRAVIERLAIFLARGRIRASIEATARLFARDGEPEAEAPISPRITPDRAPEPAPVAEPATFTDVDAATLAEALREAASQGVPFCEECLEDRAAPRGATAAAEAPR